MPRARRETLPRKPGGILRFSALILAAILLFGIVSAGATALWAFTLLPRSLPAVTAQEDGCLAANPCDWVVIVGADGFLESDWNWTAGDWLRLVVSNDDDVAHTVTIDGTSVRVTAPAIDEAQSAPFQLAVGTYTLRDQPSGHTASARAVEGDVVEYEAGLTSSGKGTPGFEVFLAVAAVGLALLLRRR